MNSGSIEFDRPVNTTWLEENFYLKFQVYWQDFTKQLYYDKKAKPEQGSLRHFEITKFHKNNQTVDFYYREYDNLSILAPLNKQKVVLNIKLRNDQSFEGLFIKQDSDDIEKNVDGKDWIIQREITEYKLSDTKGEAKIPAQFDEVLMRDVPVLGDNCDVRTQDEIHEIFFSKAGKSFEEKCHNIDHHSCPKDFKNTCFSNSKIMWYGPNPESPMPECKECIVQCARCKNFPESLGGDYNKENDSVIVSQVSATVAITGAIVWAYNRFF